MEKNNNFDKQINDINFDKQIKEENRTDFYYTCDGKKVATMEQVANYNKAYYERMMINKNQKISDKDIVENAAKHL